MIILSFVIMILVVAYVALLIIDARDTSGINSRLYSGLKLLCAVATALIVFTYMDLQITACKNICDFMKAKTTIELYDKGCTPEDFEDKEYAKIDTARITWNTKLDQWKYSYVHNKIFSLYNEEILNIEPIQER